jgi:hypothetical protein
VGEHMLGNRKLLANVADHSLGLCDLAVVHLHVGAFGGSAIAVSASL